MNKAIVIAIALATGVGGFFIGRSENGPGARGGRGEAPESRDGPMLRLTPEQHADLKHRIERAKGIEAQNQALTDALREFAPEALAELEEAELAKGTRRRDGTIVGGATYSEMTTTMATGFLDQMVRQFFEKANLTDEQQEKLREEMRQRVGEAMAISADFVNADITADEAYQTLEGIATDSRQMLTTVLDAKQLEIYGGFEKGMVNFVHGHVVNNEMATLRKKLRLDREQEKHVRKLVESRYQQVQERLNAPIPNMFFRPIRRDLDRDIYDQTGIEIATYLRPDQAAQFALVESGANKAFREYRSLLIPKTE